MRLLRYLAGVFIDTFGITHPSPAERDTAALYIAFIVLLVFLLLGGVAAFAVRALLA